MAEPHLLWGGPGSSPQRLVAAGDRGRPGHEMPPFRSPMSPRSAMQPRPDSPRDALRLGHPTRVVPAAGGGAGGWGGQQSPRLASGSPQLMAGSPMPRQAEFRASLPFPPRMDALVLRERREDAGVYGIGLKIDTEPPHTVQRVHELLAPDGSNINHRVSVGDILTFVDDAPIDKTSIDAIEQAIFGEHHSTVKISLSSKASGRLYDVHVKRHVAIATWEHVRRWYEVRDDLQPCPQLLVDAAVVGHLEALRLLVSTGSGRVRDLLCEGGRGKCTLGVLLAVNSRNSNLGSRQVQGVILGSSAHVVGNLMKGDEILMVDGETATGENLPKLIRGCDAVGSRCTLKVDRQGQVFDIELTRTQMSDVRSAERILDLLETHERSIRQQQLPPHAAEALLSSLQMLLGQIITNERRRQARDEALALRLNSLQCAVFEGVNAAESMLCGDAPSGGGRGFSPRKSAAPGCGRCLDLEEAIVNLRAELLEYRKLKGDYSALSARLEQIEREKELLSGQVRALADGNAKLSQKLEEGEEDELSRRKLEGMLADATGQLEKLRAELLGSRTEADRLRDQLEDSVPQARFRGERDAAARTLALADASNVNLKARVEQLEAALYESERAREEHRGALESLGENHTQLSGSMREMRQTILSLREEVARKETTCASLREQVVNLTSSAAEAPLLRGQLAELEQHKREEDMLRKRVSELEAEVRKMDKEREAAQGVREAVQVKCDSAEEARDTFKAKLEQTAAQVAQLEAMLERKDADLTAASLKHNEVLQDLQNTQLLLEQKDVEMRSAVRDAKELESVRSKAAKQARESEGAIKSLEMQLETKAGELRTLQEAVESANSSKKQAVESRDDLAQQLKRLKEKAAAREEELKSTGAELRDISENRSALTKQVQDHARERAELVEKVRHTEVLLSSKEREVAQLELQVESLSEERRKLTKTNIQVSARIVELEAVIESRESEIKVLEKTTEEHSEGKRQLAMGKGELEAQLSSVKDRLVTKQEELSRLQQQLGVLEEDKKRLQRSVNELTQLNSEMTQNGERRESEARQLQTTVSNLTNARAEYARNEAEMLGRLGELETTLSRKEAENVNLSKQVVALEGARLSLARDKDSLQMRARELEDKLAVEQAKEEGRARDAEAFREAKRTISKLEDQLQQLQGAYDQLNEKHRGAARELGEAEGDKRALEAARRDVRRLEEEVEKLEGLKRAAEQAKVSLEHSLDRLDVSSKAELELLRGGLAEKEQVLTIAREETRGLVLENESLKSKIAELQRQLKEAQNNSSFGKDRIEELKEDKKALASAHDQMKESVESLQARTRELFSQLSSKETLIAQLRADAERAEGQRAAALGDAEARAGEIESSRSREMVLESQVRELGAEAASLGEQVSVLQAEVEVLTANNANVRDALRMAEERCGSQESLLQEREVASQELLRELEASRKRWESDNQVMRMAVQSRDADLVEMETRFDQVTRGEAHRGEELRVALSDLSDAHAEKEALRKAMEAAQEESRTARFETEEWRSKSQGLERERDALRDSIRVLREKSASANAMGRDYALNVEIQHQQEQLIRSLKAQISQMESDVGVRDATLATAGPTGRYIQSVDVSDVRGVSTSRSSFQEDIHSMAHVGGGDLRTSGSGRRRGIIGLQIEACMPYRVLNVTELMNERGEIVNGRVRIADELTEVENVKVSSLSAAEVFSRLGGLTDTLVPLRFRDHVSGNEYGVIVKRHWPLSDFNSSASVLLHASQEESFQRPHEHTGGHTYPYYGRSGGGEYDRPLSVSAGDRGSGGGFGSYNGGPHGATNDLRYI